MALKLSGMQRQGLPKRGGLPRSRGRTTSLYRSGYYRPGVVPYDMAVAPVTYLSSSATMEMIATGEKKGRWKSPAEGREVDAPHGKLMGLDPESNHTMGDDPVLAVEENIHV